MLYFGLTLLFVIVMIITYKVLAPIDSPNMRLTGVMSENELISAVTALAAEINASTRSTPHFSARLIMSAINGAYSRISAKLEQGKCLDFENWIYDNYYKLVEVMSDQKRLMAAYNRLPGFGGVPRVYALASLIVKGSGGAVSENTVRQCVSAFNEYLPLRFDEVQMLPAAINLALLEYVAIFCSRSNVINQKFAAAKEDISRDKIDFYQLKYNSYAYAFVKYADGKLLKEFGKICQSNGLSAFTRADNFLSACAKYTGGVSSAIRSLFTLCSCFTDEFILSLCPLDKFLSGYKGIVYRDCTTPTKMVYLRAINKRAKNVSEFFIAGKIVKESLSENKDIAHYILPRPLSKVGFFVCAFLVGVITALLCVLVGVIVPDFGAVASIAFVPIAFCLALQALSKINAKVFSRRYMPRREIAEDVRAMIVFPVIVFSESELDEMVDNMLTASYANPDKIFSYGLLLDLPSSDKSDYSNLDKRIIQRAKQRVSALGPRFNLFVRKRSFCDSSGKFQGWEKKRGAILELNNLIMSDINSNFDLVLGNSYKVRYVVTLDSDTMLNCAYELVQIMEHPYNMTKAVVGLNVKSQPSSLGSPFAKLMSDGVGLNSYDNYIADANYDIFDSGNYTGKGIYRVKEFTSKVGTVFMDNRVLSHDFVEGAIAGCGNSALGALDNFPLTYSSYLGRNIRWLRGDWQLLPFLFPRIKDAKGRRIRNPISGVAKLHILTNILLGLVPIASIIFLTFSHFSAVPLLWVAAAFVLNLLALISSLRWLILSPKSTLKEWLRQLLLISTLPTVAFCYAKAILVTLLRLITKKNLLDWKVFAHSGGKVSFAPNVVVTVLFAVSVVLDFSWVFVVLTAVFAFGILYAALLSKPHEDRDNVSVQAKEQLNNIARDTWRFFEKQLKEKNNYLPFDNYQEEGGVGYAPRTSPTDVSFMIMGLVCARTMKLIDGNEFDFYAEKVVNSIERADKWRGNLYNWLDVYSLKRLNGYVSAVDSGNLLAALILLRNSTKGQLCERIKKLIQNTDLGAFFDGRRGLLFIGYDDNTKSFDGNYYDLLGSESMLTYLVGIGTGKLKASCFANLSARHVRYKGVSLYSWTGGAFEYMMSSLYFKYHKGSLLQSSAKAVLRANEAYAAKNNLPFWGTSESQYAQTDDLGNYQYKAFGVPNISLSNEKRKAVLSPYASLLFLPYFPDETAKNLSKIVENGLLGEFGLYEAYDGEIIKTYMAHHQGMILAAICNYFCDDALIKNFSSPDMRAAQLLITGTDIPKAEKKVDYPVLPQVPATEEAKELSPPQINLMTGGRYSVLVDESGNGFSYFDGKYISRYYNHSGGLKVYLSYGGERIDIQKDKAFFGEGQSEFIYCDDNCEVVQSACVLVGVCGEARRIKLKNISKNRLEVRLSSYMEIALAPLYEDLAHKTFSGMFVSTAFDPDLGAVTAKRGDLTLAHYFDVDLRNWVSYQTNRANFFNRAKGDDFGRVLDPIVSGAVELSLAPGEVVTLQIYNLVGTDYGKLKKQIELTRRVGYFDKALSACATVARGHGINKAMNRVASKLIYDASPNFFDGELPLVYIQSNVISERIKGKLKMLGALGLWGVRVRIVFAYYGDEFTKEKLAAGLDGLVGKNCILSFVNRQSDPGEAEKARRSATDIDEITQSRLPQAKRVRAVPFARARMPKPEYVYKLGKGGFLADGSYAIELSKSDLTPRPWSNIIANKKFGTIITESGGGYTYYQNSRENKLTEWSNDPVADECSEGIIMIEDGVVWSCAFQPTRVEADYVAIHGFGYTEFRCNYNGFYSRLREYIRDNTKYYELTLTSEVKADRNVDILFYVSPIVGDFAFKTEHNLACSFDGALNVKNLYNGNSFVIGCNNEITDYVCHKQSFMDKFGSFHDFDGKLGHEVKPCIKTKMFVPALCSSKIVFYLSADGKVNLTDSELMIREAKKYYSSLSSVSVSTGNPAIDYIAKWLPYQTLCSRFWGRTGFYQAGGAIGFRDQLQDCLAILYINPALVRSHILECAAHQFEAGDVQHWWHPPQTGVRTKISDDKLFLPFIAAEYIAFTGDENILHERIPYLEDVKIRGKDYYGSPAFTAKTGTLLEHCLKAIKASARLGKNGLVLMGGGDWNDAMDKVGIGGKGTTVWGSMFLYLVISKFMPHIKNKKPYFALKDKLKEAIDKAWDGEWYTRAYCDDGTVLGGKDSKECQIDLITQSFAAISGCAKGGKAKLALLSAASKLVDAEHGIIKLLTPPLKEIKAGYICDYPPGVRENGGQYTHGAVWYVMSLFEIGEWEYAYTLLNMLSPVNHARTKEDVSIYEVEPYVISADVYSQPAGKGGWSWYTGAASWYYYAITRYLFGISFCGDVITVSPKMPSSLSEAKFTVRRGKNTFNFRIDNSGEGQWQLCVGDRGYNTNSIKLTDSLSDKEIIVRKFK
ncbi:MAG: hypothetical protein IKC48_02275 [Clostridia bacterium]|nr:hypothetical protein [Clostridia bacterium]